MKYWDLIRLFYIVADAGSFTKAAERLHISQPSLSRSINLLEHALGVKLFHRLRHGLSLTSEGMILYQGAKDASISLDKARLLMQESDTPQGSLRVRTTASTWLLPYLMGFIERYPEMHVNIQEYHESLIADNAALPDVMIGPLPQLPEHWIHRPLTTFTFQLYASQEYLKDKGTPRDVSELAKHHVILPNESQWPLLWQGEDKPEAHIYLSNLGDIRMLALWDYRLALLPDEIALEGLVQVPILTPPPTIALYYSYPEHLKASPRVAALFDHLVDPQ